MTVTHTILNQRRNSLDFTMQAIARGILGIGTDSEVIGNMKDWKY